jgi:hypothetical protein
LALAQAQPAASSSTPPPTRGPRRAPDGAFGLGRPWLGGPNAEQRLTARLNLNATQQNTVHTALEESKVILKGVAQQERDLRTQLSAAVRAGNSANIDQISQQLSAIHQQRTATEAKALSKIYASLNADQKAKIDPQLNRSLGAPGPRGARGRVPQTSANASAAQQPAQQ